VLQIFRSVVDDPYLAALARRRRSITIDRPDRPSSIVAPNLRTTIAKKKSRKISAAGSRGAA